MKILFFIALLANVVFFLWEANLGVSNPQIDSGTLDNQPKQILLLSEIVQNEKEKSVIVAVKQTEKKAEATAPESISEVSTGSEAVSDETQNQHTAEELILVAESKNSSAGDKENQQLQFSDNTLNVNKVAQNKQIEMAVLKSESEGNSLVKNDSANNQIKSLLVNENTSQSHVDKQVKIDNTVEDAKKAEILPSDSADKKQLITEQTKQNETVCYQVGPFINRHMLNRWSRLNKINSQSIQQVKKDIKIVSSYLVYYPAAETYAQSKANVLMLKNKGIKDLWLFRKGKLKGTISLGLFVKKSRAVSLKRALLKSDLDVEIMQRYKTESVVFAQVTSNDETFKDKVIVSKPLGLSDCE